MNVNKKIKTINNKIEENKVQYNLERLAAKILALLSGDVGKYESLTGKDALPEKGAVEKLHKLNKLNILC